MHLNCLKEWWQICDDGNFTATNFRVSSLLYSLSYINNGEYKEHINIVTK